MTGQNQKGVCIKKFKLTVCGAGPAGISPLVHLEEKSLLDTLLNQGVCVVEASAKIGSGTIGKYQITANSLGKIFFEILGKQTRLHSYLRKRASFHELMKYYDEAPPLPLVGEFLEDIGKFIAQKIESNPCCQIQRLTSVTKIRIREDGLFEISLSPLYQQGDPETILSEKILYNLGGAQPQVYPTLSGLSADKIINSGDFITGVFDNKLAHLLSNSSKPISISIIGGSHSGFSVLYRLKNQFGLLNSEKAKIQMLSRSSIRLFYNTRKEAMLDGYTFEDDDVCLSSDRVNRYSGLRYDSFNLAKEVLSGLYQNFSLILSNAEQSAELSKSDLIIVCTGYTHRAVELLDKNDEPLAFLYDNGCLKTNERCNPLLTDGQPLKNFYQYGLGAGLKTGGSNYGEVSFKGRIDGVWVYQHLIPEKIFDRDLLMNEVAKNPVAL